MDSFSSFCHCRVVVDETKEVVHYEEDNDPLSHSHVMVIMAPGNWPLETNMYQQHQLPLHSLL